jgi:heme exporter protein C
MWTWFYRLASPPFVYRVAARLTPWFFVCAALTIGYGVVAGLVFAPPDYQQGDAFRIIYVHAPAAWLSTLCYTTMAVAGAIALIWRIKVGHAVAAATAPIGASFTLVSLRPAFEEPARGDRAAALLALVGVVNVPIIHYSVLWWNSLHQGATVAKLGKPSMPGSMLWPLLSMLLGFMLFYGAVLCIRLRGEVLNRERNAAWVRETVES